MIFMANTGSKTTAGLVPLTIMIVVLPGLIGMRLLTVALFALAVVGTGLATLGIVFIDPLKQFAHTYFPDLTYTGRVTLWEFAGEMLAKQPWFGYGYDSFWGSKMLLNTDQPFDRPWDIRTIVHGHDGYLDIALVMGIPALCVALFTFLIEPLRDYRRIPHIKENIFLGDFFMMIVLFTALNAFLEILLLQARRPGLAVLRVRAARLEAGRPLPHPLAPRGIARHFQRRRRTVYVEPFWRIDMSVMVVLAGCGNMGFAMLSGWLKSGKLSPAEVFVVEPNAELRERAAKLGAATAASAADLPADIAPVLVIFAVKPQVMRDVVPGYARFAAGGTTFLSIAAGIGIAVFEELLGESAAIVRCMPNTPAAIGKGMMVVVSNRNVDDKAKAFVADLLSASGEVATIDDEGLMDAVTAVSGSGPAYIFHFIEALTVAAEKAGLPADTAKLLAMQTVYGAASLAAESREDPGTLRKQVTSPNGTTAAALGVLMGEDRLTKLLTEAVEAARLRSIELGK